MKTTNPNAIKSALIKKSKKVALVPFLSMIFFMNIASTCSNDDNSSSASDPTLVINTVTQGTWRVTYYFDTNTDETSNFSGYNFTFGSSNALVASNGTNTYTGTWSVTSDDSNDDNPSNDLDFNILFTSPANFADLSDDWNIVSRTSTKIQLIDVSGGNGGTDYLTLEKN